MKPDWRRGRPDVQLRIRSSPDRQYWGEASTIGRRVVAETVVDETIEFRLPAADATGFLQVQVIRLE